MFKKLMPLISVLVVTITMITACAPAAGPPVFGRCRRIDHDRQLE